MSNSCNAVVIAIDGPSASGKSTVSRLVAEQLEFVYVDSGSLYRAMTWHALRKNVDVKDRERVIDLMTHTEWDFFVAERTACLTVDGDDPGMELRSEPVRESVSDVAAIPEVRTFMVERLREMRRFGNLTVEGRDIGSVVFPMTPFKFYLDADPEERARRRCKDLVAMEGQGDVKEVLDSLTRRDTKDTTRETAPLQIALGARVIDTTGMSQQAVVDLICREVREAGVPQDG